MEIRNDAEREDIMETKTENTDQKKPNKGERTKRLVTVIAVVLCVGAAAYLNWSYNKSA